jgi:ABC-2 type transport system permease protein
VRVYLAVLACGLRRYSTYRAATAAGVLTNSVFGLINAMVMLAVFHARPHIGGFDAADAVTQVFVAQAMIGPAATFGPPLDLGDRIREGDIAVDLLRPAHLTAWWLAHDLGRAAFAFAFRSLPTFLLGALVFPLVLPHDPVRWAAVLAAVVLATLVGFGLRYLYSLAGFWVLDTRGINAAAWILGPICAGMLLPLVLFPTPVADVMRALPWSALVQVPADILLGKTHLPGGTAGALAYQALWAAALLAIGAALTARATRRVVVHGG